MSKDFFCSASSKSHHEKYYATASVFTHLMLIEYAGSFDSEPLLKNTLPESVKIFLDNLRYNHPGLRILFIKKHHSGQRKIAVYCIKNDEVQPYTNKLEYDSYADLLSFKFENAFSYMQNFSFTKNMYLVCTNGKKDKCCSKFGIPIYKKLKSLIEDVWECTHIGGDRFAPNVLILPYCLYFGHLELNELDLFVAMSESNKICLQRYRGRACYSSQIQAAEYFLRKEISDLAYDNFVLIKVSTISDHTWTVVFKTLSNEKLYSLTIHSKTSDYSNFLTCKAEEMRFTRNFVLQNFTEISVPNSH